MEGLKIIPQVFFDLIARVIPGAAGIISYLILFDKTWGQLTSRFLGSSTEVGVVLSIFIFLGAAYVVGHLLSPAAKYVQRLGERKIFHPAPKEEGSYDDLRLRHPEVGALCAKIRAEFTMYNGLAVVFALSAAYYPFSKLQWNWFAFTLLVVITLSQLIRGKETRDTFNKTTRKFFDAAKKWESAKDLESKKQNLDS
jgi:hypothetical protein